MTRRVTLRACGAVAALAVTWTVHAQQRPRPTFRTSSELVVIDLVAVDSHGRFIADLRPEEIDSRTGTVLESELVLKTSAENVVLRTRFVFDERLQVHLPSEMTETHLMKNGAKLETVAHYGRFRTFAVSTSQSFK